MLGLDPRPGPQPFLNEVIIMPVQVLHDGFCNHGYRKPSSPGTMYFEKEERCKLFMISGGWQEDLEVMVLNYKSDVTDSTSATAMFPLLSRSS